ncbi:hypothetical protein O181_021783 [Austropuccinia psidii MF-1]|uniref:Uncharacterized protein n=1 Tax=Austropuccinia psidii MF-1 TaxID=1389203 RepID=A0A9Q3CFJ3_9BASI|nr:hypothetical protein [Austropuccinia psidii MF-1]
MLEDRVRGRCSAITHCANCNSSFGRCRGVISTYRCQENCLAPVESVKDLKGPILSSKSQCSLPHGMFFRCRNCASKKYELKALPAFLPNLFPSKSEPFRSQAPDVAASKSEDLSKFRGQVQPSWLSLSLNQHEISDAISVRSTLVQKPSGHSTILEKSLTSTPSTQHRYLGETSPAKKVRYNYEKYD